MSKTFEIGDRVRLRLDKYYPGYKRGDTGTVVAVMPSTAIGKPALFQVLMDGDSGAMLPSFFADELECQ